MKLWWLFPYQEIVIRSPLSLQEVYLTLKNEARENSLWRTSIGNDEKMFYGHVDKRSFDISRYRFFSNQRFKPILRGTMEEDAAGTAVRIRCRLWWMDKVAVGVLGGFTAVVLLVAVISLFAFSADVFMPLLASVGSLAVILGIFYACFVFHVARVVKEIRALLCP